ncbi:BtrH N-terminal domain-containing protein [Bacillus atrophaeus]|uniref:BtrH N-terminal domain-containing protein n=1 Tax=Bacillus atrophaeus TaxID=1452 RepID=UPI002163D04D|nr:BtrH N-terminal domain-containing protein [Bacillus atrophaeus]
MKCEAYIPGIQPFNELFYRSCFFNCYFSVVRSFQQEMYPYLLNDIYSYQMDEEGYPIIERTEVHDPEHVMNLQGIYADKQSMSGNLITDIKQDILENKPVIIWLDTYAQPYRQEYMSKHNRNCMLIYGFHDAEQTVLAIENRYPDNLSYETRNISNHHLVKAYQAYHDYFQPPAAFHSYASFSYDPGRDCSRHSIFKDAGAYFVQNVTKYLERMLSGLASFSRFIDQFHSIRDSEKLLHSFNGILNIKKIEQYRLALLPAFGQLTDVTADIIKEWETARHLAAKLYFSGGSSSGYEDRIKDSLKKVLELEAAHIECLKDIGKEERVK